MVIDATTRLFRGSRRLDETFVQLHSRTGEQNDQKPNGLLESVELSQYIEIGHCKKGDAEGDLGYLQQFNNTPRSRA